MPSLGVCDGICSNTPGDRYTLPTRDLVSSEVETLAELNMLEGMVIMANCDKIVPGMLMGALRVNIPTVMFTGGYMAPGEWNGKMLTLTHTKQAYAALHWRGHHPRGIQGGRYATHALRRVHAPLWAQPTPCAQRRKYWAFSPHGNASIRSQTPQWHEMARQAARTVAQAVRMAAVRWIF